MSGDPPKQKRFLFVDDDAAFLDGMCGLFADMSGGTWEIARAENHAQALAQLNRQSFDVLVLDVNMPVMDGVEFLRLLRRTHPNQQIVMLTGLASEETRKTCLELGAILFLEKMATPQGFEAVFAALDALTEALPQIGFRGVMRRVGLPEVLQMECLGRKSSVLEVFTGKVRGRIYIHDGAIVHADSGSMQGEVALYGLLALQGGEFNLLPFTEPPTRTISGHYEFLLMEAARLSDEGSAAAAEQTAAAAAVEEPPMPASVPMPEPMLPAEMVVGDAVHIEEVLLCSGAGEVLYEWQCAATAERVALLGEIERLAGQMSSQVPAGRFERLEVHAEDGRMVCQIQPHMRLLVRSLGQPTAAP